MKRHATTIIYNDENENPFAQRVTRAKARDVVSLEFDELADLPSTKTSLAKHGNPGSRIALSPTKIKTHFNTVKLGNSQ